MVDERDCYLAVPRPYKSRSTAEWERRNRSVHCDASGKPAEGPRFLSLSSELSFISTTVFFVRSNSLFSSINSYLYAKIFTSLFHSVQGMPLLREYNLELSPPFETVLVFSRPNFES